MTFEEQFPSLKGLSDIVCHRYLAFDIQEHCLDKQRVKDAFRSCATIWDYEKAKRELRLDK